MFKIESLVLASGTAKEYDYHFSEGLNYISGSNDTGKTAFSDLIDFMLGGSDGKKISQSSAFNGTLSHAVLTMEYDGQLLCLKRWIRENKYEAAVNDVNLPINDEASYRRAINDFLNRDTRQSDSMYAFTESNLTFRTFTLFSFLDENAVGCLDGFYSKLQSVKYRVKARDLFDYLFNPNPVRLKEIERQIFELQQEMHSLESQKWQEDILLETVNQGLTTLGVEKRFIGKNIIDIRQTIDALADAEVLARQEGIKDDLASLRMSADTLADEIQVQTTMLQEMDKVEALNRKRVALLETLEKIAGDNESYANVVAGATSLLRSLKCSTSIADLDIQREILKKKRTCLQELRRKISTTGAKLNPPKYADKQLEIALICDCLDRYKASGIAERMDRAQADLRRLRNEAKEQKVCNDEAALNAVSKEITDLYLSAGEVSSFVQDDALLEDFCIEFKKEGVLLQPKFAVDKMPTSYFAGSRARHSLMQLCGYLALMAFLVRRGDCPIVPILVFDHPSSPFDDENSKAIGAVFEHFYEGLDKSAIQVFLLEPTPPEKLGINPDTFIDLCDGGKSGFNPFWTAPDK